MKIKFGKLPTLFALIFALLNVSGNIFAQDTRETEVGIGKTRSFPIRQQIYSDSVRVSIKNRAIAQGRIDSNTNSFVIEGLAVGTTELNFSGKYRMIIVGDRIEEKEIPFTEKFVVTVLPRVELPDEQTRRINISVNRTSTFDVKTYLGEEFKNFDDDGLKWRNFRFVGGDESVAGIETNRNRMQFRINGIRDGKTIITIQGDKMKDRVWKPVIRHLEIVVGTGILSNANLDKQLFKFRQEYREIKNRMLTIKTVSDIRSLTQLFELFTGSVEAEIGAERRLANPRAERISTLEEILNAANQNIRQLQDAEKNVTAKFVRIITVPSRRADADRAKLLIESEGGFKADIVEVAENAGLNHKGRIYYQGRGESDWAYIISRMVRDVETVKPYQGITDNNPNAVQPDYSLWIYPKAQTTQSIDLNGEWVGNGYSSCTGRDETEIVRIRQEGTRITAVKTIGNPCIGAGEVTFRGNYTQDSFDGETQVRDRNTEVKRFVKAKIFVKNSNVIEVIKDDGNKLTFRRKIN